MEWVSVNERLPKLAWKYKVRLSNGDECSAFFYTDKMEWVGFYNKNHSYSHWYHTDSNEPYDNVTHWLELPET